MNDLELAKALDEGTTTDVWYDAEQFRDKRKSAQIESLQAAMVEASKRLGGSSSAPKEPAGRGASVHKMNNAQLATALNEGKSKDIWYDEDDYGDDNGSEAMERIQAAISEASNRLESIGNTPKHKI